ADHLVRDLEKFNASLNAAIEVAQQGKLVTFGIVPTRPETGYGYIKSVEDEGLLRVAAFVEKPNLETAEAYLRSGDYYWNSGMFVFSARRLIEEIEVHQPAMLQHCRDALDSGVKDLDFFRLD